MDKTSPSGSQELSTHDRYNQKKDDDKQSSDITATATITTKTPLSNNINQLTLVKQRSFNLPSKNSNLSIQEHVPNTPNFPLSIESRFALLRKLATTSATMMGNYSINCELLIDLLNAIYYECQTSLRFTPNKNQQKFLEFINPLMTQIIKLQLQAKDFDLIKVIGFGNFGQVSVVRHKENNLIYAMKTLNKAEMLRRAETACFREERDILLHGGKTHDWFTKLHYAFQDDTNLFFIMDYYVGGDLMTLLSKFDDILPESMTKFYSAQIIKAISVLHDMGYIHRDIKPDNILLDAEGQARLADFGSCIKVSSITNDGLCTRAVGTPDYISPDVLKAMEGDRSSGQLYDYNIDWWSMGVVIFESLYGETPFYAESLAETYSKIMNHEMCFKFPDEPKVSQEVQDLMSHLICDQSKRFQTLDQFQNHPWFKDIDWDNLRHLEPPYKPVVSGPDDTSNFDLDFERPNNNNDALGNPVGSRTVRDQLYNLHLPFVGFSATFSNSMNVEHDKNDLAIDNPQEISHQTRSIDKSFESDRLQKRVSNASSIFSDDYELSVVNVHQLELDLKEAQQQWSDLSVIVNEVRKEKQVLSSQLKVKETELESQIEKTTEMRKKLAKAEVTKRQNDNELARLNFELEKERQLNHHLQMEISNLENKAQKLQNDVSIMTSTPSSHDLEEDNKDELIAQHRDYIAHLEEQVMKLQQLQPNWERQVAAATNHQPIILQDEDLLDNEENADCTDKVPESPIHESLYDMTDYSQNNKVFEADSHKMDHSSSATWRERRSAKAERHEFKELQLSLQNELDDKRRIQNDLEEKKRELCQALADLADVKSELVNIKHEQQQNQQQARNSISHRSDQSLLNSIRVNTSNLTSGADFIASLKRDSSLHRLNQTSSATSGNTHNQTSNYQAPSNLSNHSTYVGDYSSAEEGYSEAESAYRQIRQPFNSAKQSTSWNNTYSNIGTTNGFSSHSVSRSNGSIERHRLTSASSTKTKVLNRHMFVVRTFIMPLKCNLCTSLMTGLVRQGLVCESCGIACHVNCAKSMWNLNCPHDEKRPIGLDAQRGIGTAYSGYVRIPRPGGVRKGWMRIYVVVCDFKLFLYDISGETSGSSSGSISLVGSSSGREDSLSTRTPGVSVTKIIDLRDENFSVSSVLESDVIHASKTDISCIFRLSSSMIGDELSPHTRRSLFYQLMLVDKESEKVKWIEALNELHRIVKRNNLPLRNLLATNSVITTAQLTQSRSILTINCCAILDDRSKILVGCDEALICCYLDLRAFHKLTKGKKVVQLSVLKSEQLIVTMCGKQRHVKLIPMRALENDSVVWIKIPETKSSTLFVTHTDLPGSYISVAVKKTLYIYEITRRQCRYGPWKEIQSNAIIQTLNVVGSLIIIGTCSNFHVHSILSRDGPPIYLINSSCSELIYITQNPFEPMGCFKLTNDNWLLVYENHGVYVNSSGYRSKDFDLHFVTKCNYISTLAIIGDDGNKLLLLGYSDNHIDVYDVESAEWLQTINLRQTRPLQSQSDMSALCVTGASDLPLIIQITRKGDSDSRLIVHSIEQSKQFIPKSNLLQKINRQSPEVGFELYRKVSRVQISEPSDFKHLSHIGPSTKSTLIDLSAVSDSQNYDKDFSSHQNQIDSEIVRRSSSSNSPMRINS